MKMDMAGGAAVLGTITAAARLQLPINLVALIPAVENLPSGHAIRPGDILTSLAKKTIEVLNTDAEGRLILADAITYAQRYQPEALIDVATLTGACIVALGHQASAILGTDQPLIDTLIAAGDSSNERLWQLPLWDDYDQLLKSDVADIKNSGGRAAGTITGAAFLKAFAGEKPWAHLDIAGTAWEEQGRPGIPKGGSGVGVRLLIDFLRTRVEQ
jgi:leucyl aminopeptidase